MTDVEKKLKKRIDALTIWELEQLNKVVQARLERLENKRKLIGLLVGCADAEDQLDQAKLALGQILVPAKAQDDDPPEDRQSAEVISLDGGPPIVRH